MQLTQAALAPQVSLTPKGLIPGGRHHQEPTGDHVLLKVNVNVVSRDAIAVQHLLQAPVPAFAGSFKNKQPGSLAGLAVVDVRDL